MQPDVIALDLALVALCGGIVGLDRRGAFQFMVSQPLVAVPLLGLMLGDVTTGLWLGALLQLLWMSSMLFGANTPPNETLSSIAAGGMVLLYGRHIADPAPVVWVIAVLLAIPLGALGRLIDVRLEQRNRALSERALAAVAKGDLNVIDRLPWIGLSRVFLANALVGALASGLGLLVLAAAQPWVGVSLERAMTAVGAYVLPALGLAVALSLVRRRRAIALALVTFAAVSMMLDHGGAI